MYYYMPVSGLQGCLLRFAAASPHPSPGCGAEASSVPSGTGPEAELAGMTGHSRKQMAHVVPCLCCWRPPDGTDEATPKPGDGCVGSGSYIKTDHMKSQPSLPIRNSWAANNYDFHAIHLDLSLLQIVYYYCRFTTDFAAASHPCPRSFVSAVWNRATKPNWPSGASRQGAHTGHLGPPPSVVTRARETSPAQGHDQAPAPQLGSGPG